MNHKPLDMELCKFQSLVYSLTTMPFKSQLSKDSEKAILNSFFCMFLLYNFLSLTIVWTFCQSQILLKADWFSRLRYLKINTILQVFFADVLPKNVNSVPVTRYNSMFIILLPFIVTIHLIFCIYNCHICYPVSSKIITWKKYSKYINKKCYHLNIKNIK